MYDKNDASTVIVAIGSTVSAIVAASCFLLTLGLETISVVCLLRLLGIAFAVNAAPLFQRYFKNVVVTAVTKVCVIVTFTALGMLTPATAVSALGNLFSLLGWCTTIVWVPALCRWMIGRPVTFLAISLLAVVFVNEAWAIRNPLVLERLAIWGDLSWPDALFNSALVASLSTYGQASLALDGVNYFSYHHGVNLFIAALANLSQLSPLYAVIIAFPIVCLGWVLTEALFFAQWLMRLNGVTVIESPCSRLVPQLLVISCFLAGVFPGTLYSLVSLPRGYVQGENTPLAVGLFLNLVVISVALLRRRGWTSAVINVIAMSFFVLFLSWTKGFLAHIALLGMWYSALKNIKDRRDLLACAVSSTLVYQLTSQWFLGEVSSKFLYLQPLGYLREWIVVDNWFLFPLIASFWTVVWAILVLGRCSDGSLSSVVRTISQSPFSNVEASILLVFVSFGPALILGGRHSMNCFQYSHIAQLISICGVMCEVSPLSYTPGLMFRSRNVLTTIVFGCLFLAGCFHVLINTASLSKDIAWRAIQDHGKDKMTPLGMDDVPGIPSLRTELRAGRILAAADLLAENSRLTRQELTRSGALWSVLRQVSELGRNEKRDGLLLIPRQNTFWDSCSPEFEPLWDQKRYLGFFAVGLTGVGLLNGAPAEELRGGRVQYGFGDYAPARALDVPLNEDEMRRETEQAGFVKLWVVRSVGESFELDVVTRP